MLGGKARGRRAKALDGPRFLRFDASALGRIRGFQNGFGAIEQFFAIMLGEGGSRLVL